MFIEDVTKSTISERWKNQFFHYRTGWKNIYPKSGKTSESIYKGILEIESKGEPDFLDQIDDLIGNDFWTKNSCSCCPTKTRNPVIRFDINGGEYDYDLCLDCLKKSIELLENAK
jgi:hypothetical protein